MKRSEEKIHGRCFGCVLFLYNSYALSCGACGMSEKFYRERRAEEAQEQTCFSALLCDAIKRAFILERALRNVIKKTRSMVEIPHITEEIIDGDVAEAIGQAQRELQEEEA